MRVAMLRGGFGRNIPAQPILVAGYDIRLLADDLTGANGASVSSWQGTGITLSSSGTAPLLMVPGIGSRKAVNFIGSGYLTGSYGSSLAAPATYHYVVKADQVADAAFIIDSTTGRHALFQKSGDGTQLSAYQTTFGDTLSGVLTTNATVITVVFNGASSKIRINGSPIATVDSGTNATAATMYLGVANDGSSFPFDGRISAVIAYDSVLSDDDIAKNERSLCNYYGVPFAGYTIGDTTVDGQNVRILRPSGLSDGTAAPLCIYHHGYGENQISLTSDPLKQSVIAAIISAGYRVASSNAHGNNWGNQDSMDDYKELYDALVSASVNISRVVFLSQSMGGVSGLNCLADTATWGSVVKGWYGIYPVCDIASMESAYSASIDSAYPPSGDFTGYNPVDMAGTDFTGKRLRFTASSSDTVVSKTDNADAMSTLVAGEATEYAVVTHTGDHGDPSAFIPSDVVDFFSRCT